MRLRSGAKRWAPLVALLTSLLAGIAPPVHARGPAAGVSADLPAIAIGDLPREARRTLELVRKGGPFPYERDGVVFGNFERALPERGRGYYREYTVPTPGLTHRGARRIVAGRNGELYYTDDHYRSFKRIRE